jgi:hypothetical protein
VHISAGKRAPYLGSATATDAPNPNTAESMVKRRAPYLGSATATDAPTLNTAESMVKRRAPYLGSATATDASRHLQCCGMVRTESHRVTQTRPVRKWSSERGFNRGKCVLASGYKQQTCDRIASSSAEIGSITGHRTPPPTTDAEPNMAESRVEKRAPCRQAH